MPGPPLMRFVFLPGPWKEEVDVGRSGWEMKEGTGQRLPLLARLWRFLIFAAEHVCQSGPFPGGQRGMLVQMLQMRRDAGPCTITAISLPLKEQLVVSHSMLSGCQRGSDQPSLLCFLRTKRTQRRAKHSPEKKKLGNVCVPGARRAGCDGASWRADVGGTQLHVWGSLVKGRQQNSHPQNPPWVLGNHFTNSPFQPVVPGEVPLFSCL